MDGEDEDTWSEDSFSQEDDELACTILSKSRASLQVFPIKVFNPRKKKVVELNVMMDKWCDHSLHE